MSPGIVAILRVFHILGGVFWVGAVIFVAAFLGPALRQAGPAGGAVMGPMGRRLPIAMMLSMAVTVIAGFLLYWHNAQVNGSPWLGSGPGRVFGMGGLLALLGGVVGMVVSAPAGRKLGTLGAALAAARRAPTPDEAATLEALQRRVTAGSVAVAVLVTLATVCMAVARYVS